MASSSDKGRRSPPYDRPDMRNLRIVLIGKNGSENSRVGNTILGTRVFQSEAALYSKNQSQRISGKVEDSKIAVIKTSHLLQPDLTDHQLTQRVSECVSRSAPGPHVIMVVVQYKDFTDADRHKVKDVLNLFGNQAINHTVVLTTDEETRAFIFTSKNETVHSLIKECGGGHLKFDETPGWRSEFLRKIEEILEDKQDKFLTCDLYEDRDGGSSVDGDQRRSAALVRGETDDDNKLKESTNTGEVDIWYQSITDSLETWFQSQDSRDREDELRIVLLGKTGVGKSATGNTILGNDKFNSHISAKSVTKECQKQSTELNGRLITVIDTPGLFDTELTNEEIKREISHCISMILPGPHVFLLLITLGRFTQEEQDAVKMIRENFGENSLMYTIVLFTRGDDLKNKTIDQFLETAETALKNLIETCGNRVHVFNNNQTGDRTQVSELLEKIDNMVKTNGGSYYSCKMFREMERGIQEQKEKILMEEVEKLKGEREELMKKHKEEKERTMEEERQKHDNERKRREEEFKEREERHKRDIKDREEQERKLREEWDKQRQQEKQRSEEEEERRRQKEQEMWDEFNQRHKQEKERLTMMMEEERQYHEKERKRREEEYKTEMKSEREEWEKQRQIERKRTEEEEERRRKIEKETWDDFFLKLKQEKERRLREKEDLQFKYEEEKERMKKMMEEQRLNIYKERKRRQEKNTEREEQYVRDIKDIEEKESKMQDELKREREEWEKQRQQERERREEEEKEKLESIQLFERTPEVQHTNNAEDLPSDPECLRILLFGRKGTGKSATGNTILGRNEFLSEDSTDSVTMTCQRGVGEVNGRSVAVVDTPDLFEMRNEKDENVTNELNTITEEKVVEEIVKCVSLSAPGPHVFIIVLSLGRVTQEEKDILDVMKMIFGHKAADFSIVLFTGQDKLRGQPIKQYLERSYNAKLKKLISDCGNRFLTFNNRKTEDLTQVTELLNMIEEVKKNNEGRYFSNGMFEEAAISVEERKKILEENKIINQAEVEKLETKYEQEYENMRRRLKVKRERTEEERVKLEKKFRIREESLRREFEEKEKSDQKKREEEDQKRSELEKQLRDEYEEKLEEIKRENEDLRSEHKKRQQEGEVDERKREEKYKEEQEQMTKLRKQQEEEIKKRDLEEEMRKEQEEKEREEWRRKIEEADNDKKEMIEEQQKEWEEEKKRENERKKKEREEKCEKQLRKKQELEKKRKKFEQEKEERQFIKEEMQIQKKESEQKEKEYEEMIKEVEKHYKELEEDREEEWERRERDAEERRAEKRKRWRKMIEDLKREQEKEIRRREIEERERIEREEKECVEMKQNHEEEIKAMKKKHQDEAQKQEENLNDFRKRKEQHIQELKERLIQFQNQLNEVNRLRQEVNKRWQCHVM